MAKRSTAGPAGRIPPFNRALHDNYRSTDYVCRNFRLRPGLPHPGFDAFLRQNGWRTYAFITAWNPFSVRQLPLVENRARHARLLLTLRRADLPFLPASARDAAGEWPAEEGVIVVNAPLGQVIGLGLNFGQNALMWGEAGKEPVVLWCHGSIR